MPRGQLHFYRIGARYIVTEGKHTETNGVEEGRMEKIDKIDERRGNERF